MRRDSQLQRVWSAAVAHTITEPVVVVVMASPDQAKPASGAVASRDALGRASRVINCADSELYESVRTAACKKLRLAVCNDREEQRR
jgi:hypothetical protein